MKKISYGKNIYNYKEINAVLKQLKKTTQMGVSVDSFEKKIANLFSKKYGLMVNSGSSAIILALKVLNFPKGSEIITPCLNFGTAVSSIMLCDLKPIFVDCEIETLQIDPKKIEKKITKKTKALIIVHMSGFACDMDKIQKLCKKHRLKLIEDCAHGLGTFFNKKHVGNFGISGCFSFYPTKHITTGEGGMVISNNLDFFRKIKQLKAFGIDTDIKDRKMPGIYDVTKLGFNYRMTDFQAALGYTQLIRYKKNLKRRHEIAKRYIKNLSNIDFIKMMPYSKNCSFFVFQIFSKKRDKIIKILKALKIGFSIHYLNPIPKMSYFKKKYNLFLKDFKNADSYGSTNISLPIYPKLKNSEIDFICKNLKKAVK